jgi:hypothetical protein
VPDKATLLCWKSPEARSGEPSPHYTFDAGLLVSLVSPSALPCGERVRVQSALFSKVGPAVLAEVGYLPAAPSVALHAFIRRRALRARCSYPEETLCPTRDSVDDHRVAACCGADPSVDGRKDPRPASQGHQW